MNELSRISGLLKQSYDGRPWYGRSLLRLLLDLTPERAAAQPIPEAHSIWQEVLHIIAWRQFACRLLNGETTAKLADNENWPPQPTADPVAWQKTLDDLAYTQDQLQAALDRLSDDQLQEKAPGQPDSFYVLLHGILQHDAYHVGQIALLRNATRDAK